MADQIPISGEYVSLAIQGTPVAASRTFTLNLDRATYANFVARQTSIWRTNKVADVGGTMDVDGLVVVVNTNPSSIQFNDLFTMQEEETAITVTFTLQTETLGETTFVYTCDAYITALSASTPQFGEATYTCSLILSGDMEQSIGMVVASPSILEDLTIGEAVTLSVS